MTQAFILGAGLGNRLRPLTASLPKPLVPLFHRPLAAWALDACAAVGITHFAVNTHHLPEKWHDFGSGHEIEFFHEPILLETGGGLKNIEAWTADQPLLVHNGDIFSTMDLGKLIAAHDASGLPVTLALRSHGSAKHIALDASGGRVVDIRNSLNISAGSHVFSGIYCVNPSFLKLIPAGEKCSVIPAFLDLASHQLLGAITLDEGVWLDLGDRASYLRAHQELRLAAAVHPLAKVSTAAYLENTVVGPGAVIEAGAIVRNSVIWAGAIVTATAMLDQCIVYSETPVAGTHQNADL
jgi:mannose-1-phosphate guanylyltransferase